MDQETKDKHMAVENLAGNETAQKPEAREPEKEKTDWIGEIKSIALLLLAVLAFHSLVAKPFYIPSVSMMPGLLVGDRLVLGIANLPYRAARVRASVRQSSGAR